MKKPDAPTPRRVGTTKAEALAQLRASLQRLDSGSLELIAEVVDRLAARSPLKRKKHRPI